MAFILARKVNMSQRYVGDASAPVTILEASPCTVTQVRTMDRDGYAAVQVASGTRRRITKPVAGHLAASTVDGKTPHPFRWLREFRTIDQGDLKVGDRIDVSAFKPGDRVQVTATSKGKGFQGVMRRHHFHGQDASHGTKHAHREPGSIGGGGRHGKGHVIKGMRMAGRMGGDRVTVQGLTVVAVDADAGMLELKGAVPGARGALVVVQMQDTHWAKRKGMSKNLKPRI
ncbi:MAG: 50S ribosomal protein L3 [bacterium]|nr:50S ribosomal protein L3 [bacterium]